MLADRDRLCVCGDTESEHEEDGLCAYCPCERFTVDAAATKELVEMRALLDDLPDMRVVMDEDGRRDDGGEE